MQAPGVSYDAAEDRRLIGAVFTPGVVSGFAIAASVGLTVSVSAGVAILSDGLGGCYLAYFDLPTTVTVGASATSTLYVVVSPTTGQSTIVGAAPGVIPAGARLVIGSATTSSTGVTATSTTGRVFADFPGQPSPKYLGVSGGTVQGVIYAVQGVRLGGTNRTARHYARVHRQVTQNIETGAYEALTYQFIDRNVSDYGTLPFNGGNPGRLVAAVAGDYHLSGTCLFTNTNTTGFRRARIVRFNSAGVATFTRYCSDDLGTGAGRLSFEAMMDADAGDWFEFQVYQNSGVTLGVSTAGDWAWASMRLIQAD